MAQVDSRIVNNMNCEKPVSGVCTLHTVASSDDQSTVRIVNYHETYNTRIHTVHTKILNGSMAGPASPRQKSLKLLTQAEVEAEVEVEVRVTVNESQNYT